MKKNNLQTGSILTLAVLIFAVTSITLGLGIAVAIVKNIQNVRGSSYSKQAYYTAEALQEDVLYRMKKNQQLSTSESLSLAGATADATISNLPYGKKIVVSSNSSDFIRKLQSTVSQTTGVSFAYAVQSGQGGFTIGNADVIGNVYSNGSIIGDNGAEITGGAISASTATSSSLIKNVKIGADAWAHNVIDTTFLSATGTNYCQVWTGSNKTCNTTRPDPTVQPFPISDATIDIWKADALAGGTTSSLTVGSTDVELTAKKIIGNLTVDGNLNLKGVVWVTGDVSLTNGAHVKLSPGYVGSGMIIVDGKTTMANGSDFTGTGSNTYIMLLSTSNCDGVTCGAHAIDVGNNGGAVILNAQKGSIKFANNSGAKAVTANKIIIDNSAVITYVVGLIDTTFSTGPMGSWAIDSWQETI